MKEFLEVFFSIIQDSNQFTKIPNQILENKLKESFALLRKEEKIETLKIIYEICNSEGSLYLYLLSYILQTVLDNEIVYEFIDKLINLKIDIFEKINWAFQVEFFIFTHNDIVMNEKLFELRKILFEQIFNSILNRLNRLPEYIPLSQRNKKRVLIMIQPILSINHAPTLILVNMYKRFSDIGYEVEVLSDSYKNIYYKRCQNFWNGQFSNSQFDKSEKFELDYLGQNIRGHHWEHTDENYWDNLREEINFVTEYNPEFIVSIGERNIAEAICSKFTTVVALSCTSNLPITNTNFFIKPSYVDFLNLYQDAKLFDLQIEYKLDTFGSVIKRSEVGLSDDLFLISIVGNRLDIEVTDEFIEMLNSIINNYKNVVIVVIGKCTILMDKIRDSQYKNNYVFVGYIEQLRSMISICDLYVNPPRQGGGVSAKCAIEADIPVVTMGNCDVATYMEGEFIVESFEKLHNEIVNCIVSKEYWDEKRKICEKIRAKWDNKLASDDINVFCEKVKLYTEKKEEKVNDTI